MLPREGGGASEELRLRAQYLAEQEVGQSARTQTEPLVGEPLLSEHFLDNGVIYQSIVNCVQSTRWLESNLNARLVVVLLDGLTHHVGSFGCGGRLFLTAIGWK